MYWNIKGENKNNDTYTRLTLTWDVLKFVSVRRCVFSVRD